MSSSRRLVEAVAQIRELDTVTRAHDADGRSSICHNCGKEDAEFPMPMQCARCKMAWYCSYTCMTSAFEAHAKVCGRAMELDVSAHTMRKMLDHLPDGRRLSELLRLKKRKEELQPLSVKDIETEPGLYQIPDMADEASGSSIKVSAIDERGYKFKPLRAGILFRYKASEQAGASYVEKNINPRLGDVYSFYGKGLLTITFSSKRGSKQSIKLRPRKPTPPTLQIESLGKGLMRVLTSDDCVKVKCQDSEGNRFKKALDPETLFRYRKATAAAKLKTRIEDNKSVKLIKGFGDLKITAIESTGLATSVTIPPR